MSRSDGGGSPASKDSGQVQRALADLDGESDASSVASVRGLVDGVVITSDHEMFIHAVCHYCCVRFASSFTFIHHHFTISFRAWRWKVQDESWQPQ